MYLLIYKIDGFIEEKGVNKYLNIAFRDNNDKILKKYREVLSGINSCIEKINNSKSGEYEKDYMKIKFNSDNKLPLNKQLRFHSVTVVIRSVFKEDGKYYQQAFLDDCLYESQGIDLNKRSASKECDICHYWYFLDENFNYEPYLCNGCPDLMQKAMSFNDVANVSIKGNNYRIHFWYMSKNDAINLMNNSSLNEKNWTIINFFHYI